MEAITDVSGVWQECMKIIHGRVNHLSYKTWFEPVVPLCSMATTLF